MKGLLIVITAFALVAISSCAGFAQMPEEFSIGTLPSHQIRPLALDNYNIKPTSEFLKSLNEKAIYDNSPISKGSAGFINATTSWSDVPYEVAKVSADDNILSGITFGFASGLAQGLTRGAAGVADMATFVVPPYNEPLMEPEYKVNNPDKDGYKITLLSW